MSKRTPVTTVSVTERALLQRIRRVLIKQGDQLLVNRSDGTYYIVHGDTVTDAHVDLAKIGTRLGVLRPWERMQ